MHEEVGKGFARRVTKSNLAEFAPLLHDRTKGPSGPPQSPSTGASTVAQSLFDGSKVHVVLPFTFPWATTATAIGSSNTDLGSTVGEIDDVSGVARPVLVAEIPGPGRWTQASFSKSIFVEFFGATPIDLTYIDAHGTVISGTANPIVKKSSNYCYELGAAIGLRYPNGDDGRPIGVFLCIGPQRFQYRLMMPSDQDHTLLDIFLTSNWVGPGGQMRRVTTDLDTLLDIWPTAGLPFAALGTTGD